jgi:hypothetical protein
VAFQEYRFEVPAGTRKVVLRGATAMRPDALGRDKSDGVTFRVFANGKKLLDEHRTDASWKPFEFDVTSTAGRTLTLRYETDPGPRNNSSFDFSTWGGRELVFEGYSPPATTHTAVRKLSLQPLRSQPSGTGGTWPPSVFASTSSSALESGVAIFRDTGPDGTITYRWSRPTGESDPLLGRIEAELKSASGEHHLVPLATTSDVEWIAKAVPGASRWTGEGSSQVLERDVSVGGRPATLRVKGRIQGKSLVLEVACDQPVVARFDAGGWGPTLRRRLVPVPYLSGVEVNYLPHEDLFVAAQLDWTASAATRHENTRATYQTLTDGTRNPLKERVV